MALAAIDIEFFSNFYSSFQLGAQGAITLLANDGTVLARWPSLELRRNLFQTPLFQVHLKQRPKGYYRLVSPIDGVTKYFGYEQISEYPIIAAVALAEDELLAAWQKDLSSDLMVALIMLCMVILMAILLAAQFRHRAKIEHILRKGEAQYRLLADNIADIVLLFDERGKLLYASPSVKTVLGHLPADMSGHSWLNFIAENDRALITSATHNLSNQAVSEAIAFRMTRADGVIVWLECNFKLADTSKTDDGFRIVGIWRDVTQRRANEDDLKSLHLRLAQLASTDGLTGLANRRTFDGFLRREFENKDALSVLLFDVDYFKGYNDGLGHPAGDACLVELAKIFAGATTGTNGLSARYGGEEFVIVLPGIGEARALEFADAVRKTVWSLNIPNPASILKKVTVSVGIASKTGHSLSELLLVAEADIALYEAKRLGRNQCIAYTLALENHDEAVLAPA